MGAQMRQGRKQPPPDPRIGLALGSGAARGWAHIGVINALTELGIRPGIVTGTSVGSLVGAGYASGQLDQLESWVRGLDWMDIVGFFDVTLLGGGLIQGEKLLDYMRAKMKPVALEELDIPLGIVATDLNSGREVWFREGPLLEAIRASIALPGLFTPVRHEGRWLVDGGLVDPVPVSLCRAMGAETVIAVNLNGDIVGKHFSARKRQQMPTEADPDDEDDLWASMSRQFRRGLSGQNSELLAKLIGRGEASPGLFDVMAGSINIMQDRITRSRMAGDPPEVVIAPRLAQLKPLEFDQAAIAIAEGRAAVERMRPALAAVLEDV